ncbi:lytic transglycosylase domain-containing protein [bacterium]|nr:lytic transglycosylase domain-containing protein [bacterium]
MKTNMRHNKIKAFLKKTGLFLVLSVMLVLNEGCNSKPQTEFSIVIQDEIRENHAEELLGSKAQNDATIKSFDGDAKFARYIASYLKKRNKKIDAEKFTQVLMNLSKEQSYDPIFLLAVIKTESSFNANAIGGAGEIGLMQIKPDTAEWIANKKNIEWKGAKALKDPEYNILIGASYFKYLKNSVKSDSLKYVNAYNTGLASMHRMPASGLKKHPYFGKVINNYLSIYADLKKIKAVKAI